MEVPINYNETVFVDHDDGAVEFLKGAGRMFYMVNPKDSLFGREEDNIYVQVCKDFCPVYIQRFKRLITFLNHYLHREL